MGGDGWRFGNPLRTRNVERRGLGRCGRGRFVRPRRGFRHPFGWSGRCRQRHLGLEVQRRRDVVHAVPLRRRWGQLLALQHLTCGAAADHVGTEAGLGRLLARRDELVGTRVALRHDPLRHDSPGPERDRRPRRKAEIVLQPLGFLVGERALGALAPEAELLGARQDVLRGDAPVFGQLVDSL